MFSNNQLKVDKDIKNITKYNAKYNATDVPEQSN